MTKQTTPKNRKPKRGLPREQSLAEIAVSAVLMSTLAITGMAALGVFPEDESAYLARYDTPNASQAQMQNQKEAIAASIIESSGSEAGYAAPNEIRQVARSLSASAQAEAREAITALGAKHTPPEDRLTLAAASLSDLEARLADTYREDERIRTERIETLMAMGLILSSVDRAKAAQAYKRVTEIAPEVGMAHNYLGHFARTQGEYDAAHMHYARANRAAADPATQIQGVAGLAYIAIDQGDLALAKLHSQEALSLAEDTGDAALIAEGQLQLARLYYRLDDNDRTRRLCDLALQGLSGHDAPLVKARIHNTLGGVAYRSRDLDEAVRQFEHAARSFSSAGYGADAAWSMGNVGVMQSVSGDLDAAERALIIAYETAISLNNIERQAGYSSNLAKLYERKGDIETSCVMSGRAVEVYRSLGSPRADALAQNRKTAGCAPAHIKGDIDERVYARRP